MPRRPITCREHTYHDGGSRLSCPRCEGAIITPRWPGLRPHRTFLGSGRTPYEQWARSVSLYTWPLWRNWKLKPSMRVETPAETHARLISQKPSGPRVGNAVYPWKLWHQHKGVKHAATRS